MGSKLRPGVYDCYEKAAPDEPMFILLARDASAPALVEMWAHDRERHGEEAGVVAEARECAEQMRAWRDHNRPPGAPEMSTAPIQALASVLDEQGYGTKRGECDAASIVEALVADGWTLSRAAR